MTVKTLIEDLAPDVDDIRQLHRELGTRPYRTFLVRTKWSGSRRGEGVENVVSARELDPPPRVDGLSGVSRALHSIGIDEEGGITLAEISLSETEQTLIPVVGDTEQFFYEIRLVTDLIDPDAKSTQKRRRYSPSGVPEYDAGGVGWRLSLSAQDADRKIGGGLYR